VAGASWQTVANGAAELGSGDVAPEGRVRRPGGGRKPLSESDPGLRAALLVLVEDSVRGDPESPLRWTTKSVKRLSGELARQGHGCSPVTCWRMLRAEGYSVQSNAKAAEGRQHPERDAQFRYIAAQAKEHMAAGQPVISVDAKKKEQVGNFAQPGREWRPRGDPVKVRDHSFPDPDGPGHAIPYGVYDTARDDGFVNVGTGGNTAALAVESVRRWWRMIGKDAYPGATRLLVTCDGGGSNGSRNRAWKKGMAQFAQDSGLEVTVCHFPPGTSKWNKIEHRLFSQVSLAWRGRPLTSYDVIIDTVSAITTASGLTVTAVLDENGCPAGEEVTSEEMRDLEDQALTRHDFHGDWNYTLLAVPRPAPEPEPRPERPGRCDQAALSHPALTGISAAELAALAAALDAPSRALREQELYALRGRGRVNKEGAGAARKLDLADHLLATLIRRHLHPPVRVIAALLGASRTCVNDAVIRTEELLGRIPAPPAAPPSATRIRTIDDLREYAAGHGITIAGPPGTAGTPPQATLTTPGTP
jgi:hypothetical protein